MIVRLKTVLIHLFAFVLSLLTTAALAQTSIDGSSASDWNGTWVAQGTFFSVAVTVRDTAFQVEEAQSLGFVWTAQPGYVSGSEAIVEVSYAGATAMLLATLTGDGIAVVEAATCTPEFMVVCVLAKGQQATFVRQPLQ